MSNTGKMRRGRIVDSNMDRPTSRLSTTRPKVKGPLRFEIRCNTCNLLRLNTEHPCPECRCPEYRVVT